jgi:hypothetical protein
MNFHSYLFLNNNFTGTIKRKCLIRQTHFYAVSPSKFSRIFKDEVYEQTGFIFSLCLYFMQFYAIHATDAGNIKPEPPLCESSHVPVKPYMKT